MLRRAGWVVLSIAAASAPACSLDVDGSGAGKACAQGRCAALYVCNADNRCVVPVLASDAATGAGGTAPSDVFGAGGIQVEPTKIPDGTGGSTQPLTGVGGTASAGSGGFPGASSRDAAVSPTDAGSDATTTMDASADANCGVLNEYYFDGDGDGFGRSSDARWLCAPPGANWVVRGGDCNDAEASVFPGQTKYFTASYLQRGVPSFDYDCSGREEPDPAMAGLAPDCPALALLVCMGSGFAGTGRTGDGVDPTCGSSTFSTCSGLLACAPMTSMVAPKGCR